LVQGESGALEGDIGCSELAHTYRVLALNHTQGLSAIEVLGGIRGEHQSHALPEEAIFILLGGQDSDRLL
jgi:hypothetical protein